MRNPLLFFVELLRQPAWVPAWVMLLMLANLASVAFWTHPAARIILATFVVSAMLMMALYSWFGFEKILGLGHAPWVPLLVYVLATVPSESGAARTYFVIWSALTTVSLVIDALDVWKYFAVPRSGTALERRPIAGGAGMPPE